MSELTTRTRVWFLLAAVLFVIAVTALHDPAHTIAELLALAIFLAAAIRFVGLAVRDDPTRARILSRGGLMGGVAGGLSSMAAGEERARRRRPAPPSDDQPGPREHL